MCSYRSAVGTICFIRALFIFVMSFPEILSAQSTSKEEWEKTLRAAEAEGQLTLYGCCYEYDRILEAFKKKYPKIKVATVLGPGGQLGSRILAERRGENISRTSSAPARTRCTMCSTRRRPWNLLNRR